MSVDCLGSLHLRQIPICILTISVFRLVHQHMAESSNVFTPETSPDEAAHVISAQSSQDPA